MVFGLLAGGVFLLTELLPERAGLWWIFGAICVQLRLAGNMFDGMVAILKERASAVGELYNEVPDRVRRASPIAMVPFGVTQMLVIGEHDSIVPKSQADGFVDAARQMGDSVEVTTILGAGHFELVDPSLGGFEIIRGAVLEALEPAWSE